jgi:selenocysteine-specific elongation factor
VTRPRHLVVGTAGHIDHGKSTLVRALTGTDPDRLKEEKARGITIELGFAHARVDDLTVAFVDVPGHERFVRTMLAGVGGIDAVLLVVAADESVMPQTREHFDICRLLRVARGVVALTKADLVDADTLALVTLEVKELVAGSFLDGAPVVPVSAATGEGLDALRAEFARLGAAGPAGARPRDGVARLPIDRVFSMKGFGTVVTGTLVSGRLRLEDELTALPGATTTKVRGLQVHGQPREEAEAGERVAVNLGGVDVDGVARGQTLAAPHTLVQTRRLDADIELLPGTRPLTHGMRVRLHQGTAEVLGRVSLVAPATSVEPGGRAAARIRLEAPAVLTRGDRFVLRAYSPTVTIGGGQVLDPEPPRTGVRTAGAPARFAALAITEDLTAAVRTMLDEAGVAGLDRAALVSRLGVMPGRVGALLTSLVSGGHAERAGDRLVAPAVLQERRAAVLAMVDAHHKAHPLAEGLPREEAREKLFGAAAAVVFDHVVQRLVDERALVARDRLARPSHKVALSGDDVRVRDLIEARCRAGALKPPDTAELAAAAGVAAAVIDRVAALLVRQKTLVKLDTLYFHAEALEALKGDMAARKAQAGDGRATVDVATFKERYGMTRKYAIPLLEYLDRERVTRRVGDARLVL